MDNQHKHIKGYRDLSPEEIGAMNEGKDLASQVGEYCLKRRDQINNMPTETVEQRADQAEARRWLEAGELQAQQAFMALIRSVALPTTF